MGCKLDGKEGESLVHTTASAGCLGNLPKNSCKTIYITLHSKAVDIVCERATGLISLFTAVCLGDQLTRPLLPLTGSTVHKVSCSSVSDFGEAGDALKMESDIFTSV